MMNKAGYDIGFDVGGSHIAGALFSGEKELMRLQTPYPKNEPDKASGIIAQMIEALADAIPEAAEDKLSLLNVVGIAVPGSISRDKRTVLNAYNLGFKNHPLPELIERKLNSRVRVLMANDADAAAWAEYMRGSLKGYANSVLITLGTGVGGGIILNGSLFTGGMGNGVELGHFIMNMAAGEKCSCGVRGCFESCCSATALIREGVRSLSSAPNGMIAALSHGDSANINAKLVIDCARAGDPAAKAIFTEYAHALGCGIASLINIIDPERIAIGGGVSGAGEFLLKPVREYVKQMSFYDNFASIVKATLGNDAGLVGAALLHKTMH